MQGLKFGLRVKGLGFGSRVKGLRKWTREW